MELPENLASLCRNNGWLYALVWGADQHVPRLLVVQDGYCEEQVKEIVDKMMNFVHIVGEGIIGETVTLGTTRWLSTDNFTTNLYSAAHAISPDFFKTTVLIPIPSSGVAQFGTTRKVRECSSFLDHANSFFARKEHRGGLINVPYGIFPSSSSFEGCFRNYGYSSFHSQIGDRMFNSAPSNELPHFNLDSKRFNPDWMSQSNNIGPQVLTAAMSSNSFGFCNKIQSSLLGSNPTPQPTDVKTSACSDAEVPFLPGTRLLSPFSCIESSVPARFNADICDKNYDQSLTSKVPHLIPASSLFSGNHDNTIKQFSEDSTSFFAQYGFNNLATATGAGYCESSKGKGKMFPDTYFASSHNDAPDKVFDPFDSGQQPGLMSGEIVLKELPGTISSSSSIVGCDRSKNTATQLSTLDAGRIDIVHSQASGDDGANYRPLAAPVRLIPDEDLFDIMELDFGPCNFLPDYLNDVPASGASAASESLVELSKSSQKPEDDGLFSDVELEQLLNNMAKENAYKANLDHSATQISGYQLSTSVSVLKNEFHSMHIPCIYDTSLPKHIRDVFEGSKAESSQKSSATNMSSVDDRGSMSNGSLVLNRLKNAAETRKARKRARPGEGAKPRPKDRQQIQDRVKELRGIVPNCSKCSIDSLLSETIKYMLYMQTVTKYAEKIKQANEPKMNFKGNGVVLKDNSSNNSRGATWAYEVAGQTMVCPIIVEDLTPPGQLLVEMLCEDRGLFLEIADIIRGLGLTIIKGLMEVSEEKIWARFLVEANKDVTRMDIFLSLIELLKRTSSSRSGRVETEVLQKKTPMFTNYQHPAMPVTVGLCERLQ